MSANSSFLPGLPAADRARIVSHMNDDHADAVLAYARHLGGRLQATRATLAAIDEAGMDLVVVEQDHASPLRLTFTRPLTDAHDAHVTLVRLAREAAAALGTPAGARGDRASAALERARAAAEFLRTQVKTCQLATVSRDGVPDCSVAPWVRDDTGSLFTYLSELSAHTTHLRHTPRASVLLIEDEATASHLLARRRLTLACDAAFVPRDESAFAPAMAALKNRFGPVMGHLESMHDFHLVRLRPQRARLVAGFGQAYDVDPHDWSQLRHVGDQGHTSAPAANHRSV